MSIEFRVLGMAGKDNAVFIQVDSGQSVERLLFDCGEGCVSELAFSEVLAIDHLFFSHLHMDHVSGFDSFFRCVFNRETKPNHLWGPPGTRQIMQHRLQGFLWNLHEEMAGTWLVTDIEPSRTLTNRYELREAFEIAHEEGEIPYEHRIWEGAGCVIDAITMDHRTPTIAYLVREKARRNIDLSRLAELGLKPGPWLKQLKEDPGFTGNVLVGGAEHSAKALREKLIVETPGESVAYLTDFLLDEAGMDALADVLRGCKTIICEGQYRHSDLELSRRNFHMTTVLSAKLAQKAGVDELVLFHLSDRYDRETWVEMLREAREIFPNTTYPKNWGLEID